MNPALLRRPQVEKAVDLSCASIYRLMDSGDFPRPIKIGKRAVRWRAEDIERYLADRPRSTGDGPKAKNGADQ